jgi:outer membrane PBP1 activator LpoA protein
VPKGIDVAALAAACIAAALAVHAAEPQTRTLYRWTDAEGRVQYADKPPAGFKGEVTKVEVDLDANVRPLAPAKTQRIAPDVLRDVTPQSTDIAKARREKRAKLEAALRAAEDKVAAAKAALEDGGAPKDGEQQVVQRRYAKAQASKSNCRTVKEGGKTSVVCPSLVPGEPYYDRQKSLEEALRQAEAELADAEAAYRRGVD